MIVDPEIAADIRIPVIDDAYRRGTQWLWYGEDNLFPNNLLSYQYAPTNMAIIRKKTEFTLGEKIIIPDPHSRNFLKESCIDNSFDDFCWKCVQDLVTFDGFAIKLIFNKAGKICQFQHIPFHAIRAEFPTMPNQISNYYFSNNWILWTDSKYQPSIIPAFKIGMGAQHEALMYTFNADPTQNYYPVPSYSGAFKYISAEQQLSFFFMNFISSNFMPPFIISFPNRPTKEQKEDDARNIMRWFSGSKNAGKPLIVYGDKSIEGKNEMPEVTLLQKSERGNEYNEIHSIIVQQIISAHSLTSPVLVGLSGSATLGGNTNEIKTAFQIFQNTVIRQLQNKFSKALSKILEFNELDPEVFIQQFDILKGLEGEPIVVPVERQMKKVIPNTPQLHLPKELLTTPEALLIAPEVPDAEIILNLPSELL